MRLERGRLAESLAAAVAAVRPLPGVHPHVPVEAGRLEEPLVAHHAEVRPLVRVLLPVQDDRVAVRETVRKQ